MTGPTRAWKVGGQTCAAAAWVLWLAVQIVAADPFPPEISVSQYGIGPHGWLFSVWVVVLAAAPLLLFRYRPVPGPARWLLWVGGVGSLVIAVVRTDEGGPQVSVHARVHMVGAVLAMVALPLAVVAVLRFAAPLWRRLSRVLAGMWAISGAAILMAAVGVDTAGMGAPASWAFWQGLAIVVDMALIGAYAVAVRSVPRLSRGPADRPADATTISPGRSPEALRDGRPDPR
ncbi:MAG TPA: DUF998 domain-containing protein [Nakamurella sp.]|nr:DUF998 domain-containing protein [Nakamurella sp.]